MQQSPSGFAEEKRSENDNRRYQKSEPATRMTSVTPKQESWKQRWNAVQLSKTMIVWIGLAVFVGTLIIGFRWGGWVTGGTAEKAAVTMSSDAVVQRLSSICVAQFQQDPANAEKLVELKAASSYQQGRYVKEQGWATVPGDEDSDTKVATACGRVLAQME